MALVDITGGLWLPPMDYFNGGPPVYASTLLDAAADRVACVFYAPKTGNIRRLGFMLGTVPALNGASTLVYALQDVDLTTGNPDGSDDETATIPNGSITANTLVLSGNLSADRSVTKGDLLAMVVRYGTFNSGDQVNIQAITCGTRQGPFYAEYVAANLTGSYAKQGNVPVVEVQYSDGSYAYMPAALPWNALASDAYNNSSTPDEIGLQFQMPAPCRLAGCWMVLDADGDYNINVYTSGAKTTAKSADKDVRCVPLGAAQVQMFSTPVTIAASTTYVVAVEPSSATSLTLYNATVRDAAAWDQTCGGQTWQYATAKNPSTTADFSATATKRPVMGLIFDQVDDGASAGGGGVGGTIRQVTSPPRRRR